MNIYIEVFGHVCCKAFKTLLKTVFFQFNQFKLQQYQYNFQLAMKLMIEIKIFETEAIK